MGRREEVFKYFKKYEDETNDRIQNGIEQNKKGFARICVTDKDGAPVKGVKLQISQKRHEFLYGANLFMLDELETEAKNDKYKESFKNIFNAATLPFYWDALEPEEGKPRFGKDSVKIYRRPVPDLCLEYCEQNGITPKEHCLTYFNFTPEWVDVSDTRDYKQKIERRYKACAERYASRINGWEVTNELLCNNVERDVQTFFRDDDVLKWNFELARKYFTTNELIINEASHVWLRSERSGGSFAHGRSAYYMMIKEALREGVPIDAVGMQFHMFVRREQEMQNGFDMYNPMQLYTVLDRYEKLGKPIQITEITIPAYSDTAEDEEIQAQLIERLYSIWFSHASTEAIIYWNLVDGYAAFAPQGDMQAGENYYRGGLMRFDLSKKPAYEMVDELFNKRWRTDMSVETDSSGEAKFKGFYGDYDVIIEGKKYGISTSKKKENEFKIIL